MSNFNQRIAEAYSHAKRSKNLRQEQIAERIRKMPGGETCTQAALSALKTRADGKGSIFTAQIAEVCGVDPFWLSTGLGEMLRGSNDHQVAEQKGTYNQAINKELLEFCIKSFGDALKQIMELYAMFEGDATEERPSKNNVIKMIQYKHRSG